MSPGASRRLPPFRSRRGSPAPCRQGSHRTACIKVFERVLAKLKEAANVKSFAGLTDKELDQPWIGADWRTMSGGHGFSVPFSRKKDGDPYPAVPYYLMLSSTRGGEWSAERHDFSWKDDEHSISALGVDKCLRILYQASYTPATGDCVTYLHVPTFPTAPTQVPPARLSLYRAGESNPGT